MRRTLFRVSAFLLLSALTAGAAQLPLTVKDVCLMLRMGYAPASVTQELSTRHFADAIDGVKEAQLVQAGAKSDFIAALKSGAYAVPAAELARAKEEVAAQARRRATEAERSREFDTLYQEKLAKERLSKEGVPSSDATTQFLKGALVRYRNGSVVPADDDAMANKKLILYYFSAHWCGPCRKFTPQLVEYYNRVSAQHPELEVVFYSFDKSAAAMEDYMRGSNMPWLAIDYQKLGEKQELRNFAGNAIPSLILVDATGKLLSSTYAGTQYLGPQKVLGDLDTLFAGKPLPTVAQSN